MGVLEDFEAAAAAHRAAVSAGERRAAEAADALADAQAVRRENVAEITSLLERFRRAAHGTANVTVQAVRHNWRGKSTHKKMHGWRISTERERGGGFIYLLLDIDGGVWIVSQSRDPDGPSRDRYKDKGMAYQWQLGQSTEADFSPNSYIGRRIGVGVTEEISIPSRLGQLTDQLGITI